MIHAYLVNDIRQPCTLVMMIVKIIPEPKRHSKKMIEPWPKLKGSEKVKVKGKCLA